MSRYEHLPIYNSVYAVNLYFFKLSGGFARDIKYGIAQEIRGLLTELMDRVVIANNCADQAKAGELEKAEILIERVKLKYRILKDVKAVNTRKYEYFSRLLIDISKQVQAWKKWAMSH